jgi:hypothetical protein
MDQRFGPRVYSGIQAVGCVTHPHVRQCVPAMMCACGCAVCAVCAVCVSVDNLDDRNMKLVFDMPVYHPKPRLVSSSSRLFPYK